MDFFKRIYKFLDKVEDKIRIKLSHHPLLYAFIGSVGVVLIWRGVWHIADNLNMPGWMSLILGVLISVFSGLFVSFFVGDKIIISGIKEEKRVDEKTEEEKKKEEITLSEIKKDLEKIEDEIEEIKK